MAYVEGRLDPAREALVRRALSQAPGALERAEALRQDRAVLRRGQSGAPEAVRAPGPATQHAIRTALGAPRPQGWRRWTPALVGAGGLLAASVTWVVLVRSGALEAQPDDDLARVTLVPRPSSKAPPPPTPEPAGELDEFLATTATRPSAATVAQPEMVEEASDALQPPPDGVWTGIDGWGMERPVGSAEAAGWLWERRLAVAIKVPDARAQQDQMRLLSLLSSVRMVHEATRAEHREAEDPLHAGTSPVSGPRAERASRAALYGVIDQGPDYDDAGSLVNEGMIRALDTWLKDLPLVDGGSIELRELDPSEQLPEVPDEWKSAIMARQRVLSIRIATFEPPSSSLLRSPAASPAPASPLMGGSESGGGAPGSRRAPR